MIIGTDAWLVFKTVVTFILTQNKYTKLVGISWHHKCKTGLMVHSSKSTDIHVDFLYSGQNTMHLSQQQKYCIQMLQLKFRRIPKSITHTSTQRGIYRERIIIKTCITQPYNTTHAVFVFFVLLKISQTSSDLKYHCFSYTISLSVFFNS